MCITKKPVKDVFATFFFVWRNIPVEVMACIVVNGNGVHNELEIVKLLRKRVPGLKSVVINSNRERTNVILGPKCRTVWGQDFITDEL